MEQLDENIVWAPQQGPQEALVACPITLIGYGGARGGGKTDGVLGKFAVKQEQLGVVAHILLHHEFVLTMRRWWMRWPPAAAA